jgi:hypothetical protein
MPPSGPPMAVAMLGATAPTILSRSISASSFAG